MLPQIMHMVQMFAITFLRDWTFFLLANNIMSEKTWINISLILWVGSFDLGL